MTNNRGYEVFFWSCGLGVVAVTLRLCGQVTWAWWLVTLPFWWLPAAVVGVIVGAVVLACVVGVGRWMGGV